MEGENFYADAQYANQQVTVNHGYLQHVPQGPSRDASTDLRDPGKRSFKKVWRVVAIALGLTTIGLLAAIIALVLMQNKSTPLADSTVGSNGAQSGGSTVGSNGGHNCDNTSPTKTAKSCNELRNKGSSKSGVYLLRPDENSPVIEVYCDMESDGGGWSLVASIHESDIERKCYSDDLWSSYVPGQQISFSAGNTNWENEMTFGNIHKCVEDDYKNLAYHTLNASDVMVWHVQIGFHVDIMRTRSSFRYRTTNGFLQQYGGNLKTLFNKHFPLKIKSEDSSSNLLDALITKRNNITSLMPNWYNYVAMTGSRISDATMYNSYGNRIYFRSQRKAYYSLNAGQEYKLPQSHSSVMTSSKVPFTLITTIINQDQLDSYFQIQVASYRPQNAGEIISQFENSVTVGAYVLQYEAVQFFHPSYRTPCEMYFVVSSPKIWNSVRPSSFQRTSYSYYSTYRTSTYRVEGSPSNIIFGYILLASETGYNVTSVELDKVANLILETISATANAFPVPSNTDTLVVPVVFDKGDTEEMMRTVPPTYRPYATPGYLQFRAYNLTGYPNAVCPGVKVGSISPEYLCIGGVSGNVKQYGTCGDFAGWAGISTDKMLASQASGSAHSRKDILSTILLFYR